MNVLEKITSESQKQIYLKYLSASFPFDIVGFGRDLELDIKEISGLPAKVSGFIKIVDNKVSICINQLDSPNRKRFTIAHEIGHYFLHSDLLSEGIVDGVLNRDGAFNQIEYDANEFAANLLMPENLFREFWDRDDCSISFMADFFLVSESAIITRAKFLNLVNEYYGYFA